MQRVMSDQCKEKSSHLMHKSWETFITVRDAIIKKVIKIFIDFSDENNIDASSANFESWLEKRLKIQT